MVDISSIAISERAMSDGRWVSIVSDFRIRVRSARSPEFVEAVLRARDEEGHVPEAKYRELAAEHLPTDWDGLTDGGEVVEFDPALCKEKLLSPGWETHLETVQMAALDLAAYSEKLAEAAAKN